MSTTSPRKQPPSLREARRALTQSHLSEAARELFFTHGYRGTTMDEIAQAAGASRSTVYANFKDKDEILAAIANGYMSSLCEVAASLPGPSPARAEIDAWLHRIAAFIARERTPSVLISGMAHSDDAPPIIHHLGNKLIETLAVNLPAFRRALEHGPQQGPAMAWAAVVLREVGWACQQHARDPGGERARDLLAVAGDLFEHFILRSTPGDAP